MPFFTVQREIGKRGCRGDEPISKPNFIVPGHRWRLAMGGKGGFDASRVVLYYSQSESLVLF